VVIPDLLPEISIDKEFQYFLPYKIIKLSENVGWIRDPEKTYPRSRIRDLGVKKAPNLGSKSATLTDTILGRAG
jgi:hypothetical protein